MSKLIDNQGEATLQRALKASLVDAERVDIAVGYFYLSGFVALADELINKKVRIVVGKEIDPKCVIKMASYVKNIDEDLERWQPRQRTRSATQLKQNYMDSLVGLANDSDLFEKPKADQAFSIFMAKIANGSLEIRKTKEDYHGKFYLIYKKQASLEGTPGIAFIGSSNMTYSGLIGQGELNKSITDQAEFSEVGSKFEEIWDVSRSINIVSEDNKEEFISEIEGRVAKYRTPAPYEMYARVLHELFSAKKDQPIDSPSYITNNRFSDFRYQTDAITDGLDKLERHNGAVIADVVGLGKSIIAASIARNLRMKTVIIAPPHLVPQWEDYREHFKIHGPSVYSLGKIEAVFNRYGEPKEPMLIILDEAHRYRNEDTNNYRLLHKLCRSHEQNKVLLLTATPFNNSPQDLFALIRLFQTPGQSTIRSVDNLSIRFRELIERYKKLRAHMRKGDLDKAEIESEEKTIATETKRLIENVIIRRSRLDLKRIKKYAADLEAQNIDIQEPSDPEIIEYNLGELSSLYIDTLNKISDPNRDDGLKGAKYKPATYIKNLPEFMKSLKKQFNNQSDFEAIENLLQTSQINLADFMKRLLVRRFESSKYAFQSTLKKTIDSNEAIERWWEERGKIPVMSKRGVPEPDNVDAYEPVDGEAYQSIDQDDQKLTIDKNQVYISKDDLKNTFIEDVRHDIKILRSIYAAWFENPEIEKIDPKTDDLAKRLQQSLRDDPQRKLIVFSTYADTVTYLNEALRERGLKRILPYTAEMASASTRDTIKVNFDGSLPQPEQKDDYDVLITTDAVSEGYNLHRAGTVINHDIPFNPTRVVQRIGRINRIGQKKFDKLYILNSFPTAVGEAEIKIKEISTMKIKLFNDIIGNDTKTLTNDEDLQSILGEIIEEAQQAIEEESWDAKHKDVYDRISKDTDLMDQVMSIPRRSRIMRKNQSESGVIVFGKKGDQSIFTIAVPQSKPKLISAEEAIDYFESTVDESGYPVPDQFMPIFKRAKEELFAKHPLPTIKGRRQDALKVIQALRDELPAEDGYYTDLITVIKELDDVSEGALKDIVRINLKDVQRAHTELQTIVPKQLLSSVINKVQHMEAATELILLAEELKV